MTHTTTASLTIGIDLGKRMSQFCVLDKKREVSKRGSAATTPGEFKRVFKKFAKARIVMEAGGVSPWASRVLEALGHEVIVANPRNVALISKSYQKSDRRDAEFLARLAAADLKLVSPITHRGEEAQQHLIKIKLRDALVRSRTMLILSLRGHLASLGMEVPSCSTASFHKKLYNELPKDTVEIVAPTLITIQSLTKSIHEYDREIEQIADEEYPEAKLLQTVAGVGPLTSLAFILTIDDAKRFKKSRDVSAFIGLTPKRQQSGDHNPQLGITKTGNSYLRRLLVQSAHYILGPFGKESDLREWGLKLAARGGKNAKKRAIVAVARKLAMILHRMWVTKTEFIPRRHEPHVVVKRALKAKKKEARPVLV
ncbi:MAG: IS110 family transposase [Planctomycetota bacterium]